MGRSRGDAQTQKYMIQIINFLKGKKTYIVGMLMVVLGYLNKDQQMMLEGLGLITLRAGITNK